MRSSPAQVCKAQREEMGDEAFAEEHGVNDNKANAFGKCVSEEARERDGAGSSDEVTSPETDVPPSLAPLASRPRSPRRSRSSAGSCSR